jgi:peroxiredoxin
MPGAVFPDYQLPDHAGRTAQAQRTPGRCPLILTLARGHSCPKEHQQHLELAAFYPKIAVAYTRIATNSTDDHHALQEFRASVGAQWTFLSDAGGTVQKDLDIAEYTDAEQNPMIPHALVLKPRLIIHSIYNGCWFWGRCFCRGLMARPAGSDERDSPRLGSERQRTSRGLESRRPVDLPWMEQGSQGGLA